MKASRLRLPQSILAHTMLLVISTVVLLTALDLAVVLMRPLPKDLPFSSYEVARLLKRQPMMKDSSDVRTWYSASPPIIQTTRSDQLVGLAIAHRLGVSPAVIRVHNPENGPFHQGFEQHHRELAAYGIDGFDPVLIGPFVAASRLPDGRWAIVARAARESDRAWLVQTVLLILTSLFIVAAIAWLFSKRIARPIRAFAAAADRVGRQHQAEPIEIEGPEEIKLAAAAVNDMQNRISRYVAERTSVVGALAHDLRTPLSRLQFHIASAPEQISRKAEGEIAEMEQMIAASLEFVENETRPRPSEAVDLALLVEGVVDDLADIGRDVRLDAVERATVQGDPILLRRLFANLINNAVTYGRRAAVTLDARHGEAIVDVADEGPGLRDTDLERAFEPFYRAEASRNRATGGIGLGLAIVRAAAQRHGGDVTLSNRPQGGLRARVTLPTI